MEANKKLGQNFLIQESVLEGIVEAADVQKDDLIIEIGPGLGTLTSYLLEKACKVVAVELDERMMQVLQDRFCFYHNFELMHQDILQVDLKHLIQEERKKDPRIQRTKIVANLPYYITTPIVMKLLEEKLEIDSLTIMIQKEVAERFCAQPGSKLSGAITYGIHYYTKPELKFTVEPNAFIPEPAVQSQVVHLQILSQPSVIVEDEKWLFQIIKVAFMQRRKTLMNALQHGGIIQEKVELEKILKTMQLPTNIRGENLSLEQFAQLSENLKKKK